MRRARGEGRLFRPTYTDKTSGQQKRAGVWWIQYHDPRRPLGQQKLRESSGSAKKGEAVKLVQKRLTEVRAGRPTGPDVDKVTVGELFQILRDDYRLNERRSLGRLEECLAHLITYFGENTKALAVAEDRIAAYTLARKDAGAANATINRELSALKRAFRLGERAQKVARRPHVALLAENNRRMGFFERDEHEQVKAKLPSDAADVAEFLFWSGWRRGEAVGLRWSDIDLGAGVIRIETTKSGEPRTLPYAKLPALRQLIEQRRAVTDVVQEELGAIVSWVFHRDGQPIRHFRRSWITACVKAGLGHEVREKDVMDEKGQVVRRGKLIRKIALRRPHDYRRSAARNLSRAGVPERVIMQLCGWKTRSVFDRYRIVPERELAEGLARLAEGSRTDPQVSRQKVTGL